MKKTRGDLKYEPQRMSVRKLTEEEISKVLEGVEEVIPRKLPEQMRHAYLEKIIRPIRERLRKVDILDHPSYLDQLRKDMMRSIQRAIIEPGESVGVICAQSIGERQTQLTLNSFHQSGLTVATVVTGVPRFLELLNTTRELKCPTNSFEVSAQSPAHIRSMIGHQLVSLSFGDLVSRYSIHREKEEEVWYSPFETIYSNRFRDFKACITFTLHLETLYRYRIYPMDIADALEKNYEEIACVFSPLSLGHMDVFVDTSKIDVKDHEVPSFITTENYIEIYLEDVVRPRLEDVLICGIPGIHNFYISPIREGVFRVETEGSQLFALAKLAFVDPSTLRSNNMWDIYEMMGIEATREFLIEELTSIVSSDGTFINPSHILLLVDIMTRHGTIHSISRYGLKKEQVGVLSRSSFEESLDHFCQAGFFSEVEPIRAVSASIMCGKRSSIGSGICSLRMNWEEIQRSDTTSS